MTSHIKILFNVFKKKLAFETRKAALSFDQLIYINGPNVKMRFKNSAAFLMFTFNIDFIGR